MKRKREAILYLGFALPEHIEKNVQRVDILPHLATWKYAWSVISVLKSGFRSVYIFSTAEVRNYPAVKKIVFSSEKFIINDTAGIVIGFINLIGLKHVSRFVQVLLRIPWFVKKNKIKNIIVHGTHTPFMLIAILAKYIFGLRLVIILTDQHGKEVVSDGKIGKVLRKIDTMLMRFLLNRFDAYICLSVMFVKRFNLFPYLVLPGILSNKFKSSVLRNYNRPQLQKYFVIVYAGGVNRNNGVDLLISSLKYLKDKNILIKIYGGGDMVQDVIDMSENDNRLLYGGVLYDDEFVSALKNADLLVNPRPIHNEYAQTSFPSKLIEYMSTGVPVLTSRIVSIPKEIKDCFFYIDGDDSKSIAKSLRIIKNLSQDERLSVASRAAETVNILYSEEVVGQKISDFIMSIG